jgi:glycolate oxidase
MPDVVIRVDNTEQVSADIEDRVEIQDPRHAPRAGSGLAGSAVPVHGGVVLSLEKMNPILEIDPVNRVAVVEPGVVTKRTLQGRRGKGLPLRGLPD